MDKIPSFNPTISPTLTINSDAHISDRATSTRATSTATSSLTPYLEPSGNPDYTATQLTSDIASIQVVRTTLHSDETVSTNPVPQLPPKEAKDFNLLCARLEASSLFYPCKRVIDAVYMYTNEIYTKVADRNSLLVTPARFTTRLAQFRCLIGAMSQSNDFTQLQGKIERDSIQDLITAMRATKSAIEKRFTSRTPPKARRMATQDTDELIFVLELLQKLMLSEVGQRALSRKYDTNIGAHSKMELADLASSINFRLTLLLDLMNPTNLQGPLQPAAELFKKHLPLFKDLSLAISEALDSKNKMGLREAHEKLVSLLKDFKAEQSPEIRVITRGRLAFHNSTVELSKLIGTASTALDAETGDITYYTNRLKLINQAGTLSDLFSLINWSKLAETTESGRSLSHHLQPLCQTFIQQWTRMSSDSKLADAPKRLEDAREDVNPIDLYKTYHKSVKLADALLTVIETATKYASDGHTRMFSEVFFNSINNLLPFLNEEAPGSVGEENSSVTPKPQSIKARKAKKRKGPKSVPKTKKVIEQTTLHRQPVEPLFEDEEALTAYVTDYLIVPEVSEEEDQMEVPAEAPPKIPTPIKTKKTGKPRPAKPAVKKSVEGRTHKKAAPIIGFSGKARKVERVIEILRQNNFHLVRQKGSHATMYNPATNKSVTVPIHDKPVCRRAARRISDLLSEHNDGNDQRSR
ncbi:MAG: type II toxin-antitoxin system HicA family toxin [Chlamydiales bacterium]|nr:type II toxin-antitoxin system HicA family toxin [Chlamydiales bacterium]